MGSIGEDGAVAGTYSAGGNVLSIFRGRPERRYERILFGPLQFADTTEEVCFSRTRLAYHARYKPVGEIEEQWVDQLVETIWRQRRIGILEAMVLQSMAGLAVNDPDLPMPTLTTIVRYKDQLDRSYDQCVKAIDALVVRREPDEQAASEATPHPAEMRCLADQMASHELDEHELEKLEEALEEEVAAERRSHLRLIDD